MPNVAEIIKDHVTLEVRCLDRLSLNAYIPRLQTSGGVIDFLVRAGRQKIASSTRQMGYDLRRLVRKGLITRLERQKRYVLSPYGRRVALFLTKVHARVIRPGLQALDLTFAAQTPPPLRTTFAALDRAIDAHIRDAQLAA